MVGTQLTFARTREELGAALTEAPDLVILDLTTPGWDYEAFFAALDGAAPRPPVLGFTTHALARATQPLHGRCTRVVTKETLTQELPELLKTGVAA
jgi:CheY-like chemotaxis protein